MKAKETLIVWDPQTKQIRLFPFPVGEMEEEEADNYPCSTGACYAAIYANIDIGKALLAEALNIIVDYDMPPDLIDSTLRQIDEYAEARNYLLGNLSIPTRD